MKNRIRLAVIAAMLALTCVFSACQKSVDVENTTTSADVELVEESTRDMDAEMIVKEVKSAYGTSFAPSVRLDAADIKSTFSLEAGMYEDAYVLKADGTSDLCAVFSGTNDMAAQIEVALNKYRNDLVNQTSGKNREDWMIQGSKVVRYDSYVALFILGDREQINDLNSAREQNDIGCNTLKRLLKK